MKKIAMLAALGWGVTQLAAGSPAQAHEEGSTSARQERIALCIGNGVYRKGPLRNAAADAGAVCSALESVGFDVEVLGDANQIRMEQALNLFTKRLEPGGIAFFFFSGYGLQWNGESYRLPVDFAGWNRPGASLTEEWSAKGIATKMQRAKAGISILALDACRDLPGEFPSKIRPGLGLVSGGVNTFVALAAQPGAVTEDWSRNGFGLYADALALAIRTPGIELGRLFDRVQQDVALATGQRQIPFAFDAVPDLYRFGVAPPVALSTGTTESGKEPPGPNDRPEVAPAEPVPASNGPVMSDSGDGDAQTERTDPAVEYSRDLQIEAGWSLGDDVLPPDSGLARGIDLYTGKGGTFDPKGAGKIFQRAAGDGDPMGEMWLARSIFKGRCGFRAEPERAKLMAKRVLKQVGSAADQGDPAAAFLLGSAYEEGLGVKKDPAKAVGFYRASCDGRFPLGCYNLAGMFKMGKGTERDDSRAAELYFKACDAGSIFGCNNLGLLYEAGIGVQRNETRAAELYSKACAAGFALGCANLGGMAEDGRGVEKDIQRAKKLYRDACQGGSSHGCEELERLEKEGAHWKPEEKAKEKERREPGWRTGG